jgi:hypothetical protein
MNKEEIKSNIISTLKEKSSLKQIVYDNTLKIFTDIKVILEGLAEEYNSLLNGTDERVKLEYKEVGNFASQLKIAGDLMIFSLHSNIFEFDRSHGVWKTSYVKGDKLASYCGIINIYNFLSDSFKYNRMEDLGYLVGRIFINRDFHFFTEGKRQLGFFYNNFGSEKITNQAITEIINHSISYVLDFDLLVPPYDAVKIATVEQMSHSLQRSILRTGKRLGFQFNSDDVTNNE